MKPPTLARTLIRVLASAEDRDFVLEDLDDRFRQIAEVEGLQVASLWYWKQALSALPVAVVQDIELLRRRSWTGSVGDLRLGLRTLRRRPLYALGVAGTLGLGLAAAVITFAVAWRVWLAPLSIPDPDRVVRLYEIEPTDAAVPPTGIEERRHELSGALLTDLTGHAWESIQGVSEGVHCGPPSEWTLDGESYRVSSVFLSPAGFGILGIVPMLGRLPRADETELLLSERFWRAAFGGDSEILGRTLTSDYGPVQVVGVARLPAGCPFDLDIIGVIDRSGAGERDVRFASGFARIRPSHSVEQAEAEMNAFVATLAEIHPEHRGWSIEAVPLKEDLMRPVRGVIALLLAVAATFLCLAAVNVLGLVTARRVEGRAERSVRLALGASEGRLLRGSMIEGLVLTCFGTLGGMVGAYLLIAPTKAVVPPDVPRLAEVGITPELALGGLFAGLVVGGGIGIVGYVLARGAAPSTGRVNRRRTSAIGWRRALVVGQVALTALLTASCAAVIDRLVTLRAVDLGFETEGRSITSGNLDLPSDERLETFRMILEGLEARGIRAAFAMNSPIYGATAPVFGIRSERTSAEVFYHLLPVTPEYFSLMSIELLAGRVFRSTDDASAERVVVVSADFVDDYFDGTPYPQVLGRSLEPIMLMRGAARIVGVVGSTRHEGPAAPAPPSLYTPYTQQAIILPAVSLLVEGVPEAVGEAVSDVLEMAASDGDWTPLVPYTSYLSEWYAPFRFQLLMIGVLAGLGLLLASLGLYALMAYQVSVRRQEIGIRKALGASNRSLMRGVVLPGVAMSMIGAALGLLAWYQLLPWTGELLDGVDTAGAAVPLSVALVVGLSCLIATLVPAFTATRVDPVVTLKAD